MSEKECTLHNDVRSTAILPASLADVLQRQWKLMVEIYINPSQAAANCQVSSAKLFQRLTGHPKVCTQSENPTAALAKFGHMIEIWNINFETLCSEDLRRNSNARVQQQHDTKFQIEKMPSAPKADKPTFNW